MTTGISGSNMAQTTQNSTSSPDGLAHFQKKYGNLKFSSKPFSSIEQAFEQGRKMGSGFSNILIDPKALQRMKTDPIFAKKIEKTLDEMKGRLDSPPFEFGPGHRATSSGIIIDESGGLGGRWFGYEGMEKEGTNEISEETLITSKATTLDKTLKELQQKISIKLKTTLSTTQDTVAISNAVYDLLKAKTDPDAIDEAKAKNTKETLSAGVYDKHTEVTLMNKNA